MKDNWQYSSTHWNQLGSPLRPAAEDQAFLQMQIADIIKTDVLENVLILGATPEYFHLSWPTAVNVRAADLSMFMLQTVWPGPQTNVICADWLCLPLAANSQDIVLLDGGICLLSYPQAQARLIQEVQRILRPGGHWYIRLFVLPEQSESVQEVLYAVDSGAISQINVLKLRLWVAMQAESGEPVGNHEYWQKLRAYWPDFSVLAARLGLDVQQLLLASETKDYRYYHFSGLPEYLTMFTQQPGGFELSATAIPGYIEGRLCPTVVLNCCK